VPQLLLLGIMMLKQMDAVLDKILTYNPKINKNHKFAFIDLFAGIGGFHVAAKSLGGKCLFASEIDKDARSAYEVNHGLAPHGDITKIDAKEIPDHDILFAGFPCQPFSIIGDRLGFDDIRGTLFFDISRILKEKNH